MTTLGLKSMHFSLDKLRGNGSLKMLTNPTSWLPVTDTPHPSSQENKILPTEEVFARNLNSKTAKALHSSKINSHTFNRQTDKLIPDKRHGRLWNCTAKSRISERGKKDRGWQAFPRHSFCHPSSSFTTPLVSCGLGFGFRSGAGGGVGGEGAGDSQGYVFGQGMFGTAIICLRSLAHQIPAGFHNSKILTFLFLQVGIFATQIFWLKNLIVCIFNCFNLYFLGIEEWGMGETANRITMPI